MKSLITLLLQFIAAWFEKMESHVATTCKEVVKHIDAFRLPIYSNPFIAQEPKPPTAC